MEESQSRDVAIYSVGDLYISILLPEIINLGEVLWFVESSQNTRDFILSFIDESKSLINRIDFGSVLTSRAVCVEIASEAFNRNLQDLYNSEFKDFIPDDNLRADASLVDRSREDIDFATLSLSETSLGFLIFEIVGVYIAISLQNLSEFIGDKDRLKAYNTPEGVKSSGVHKLIETDIDLQYFLVQYKKKKKEINMIVGFPGLHNVFYFPGDLIEPIEDSSALEENVDGFPQSLLESLQKQIQTPSYVGLDQKIVYILDLERWAKQIK